MKHISLLACTLAVTSFFTAPADAQSKPCPPGLAKKNLPCVPPGLAKEGVTTQQYLSNRYDIGDRLRGDNTYSFLDDWWEFGLPDPANDELYIRVDNDIFRVASTTMKVLEAWKAVRGGE